MGSGWLFWGGLASIAGLVAVLWPQRGAAAILRRNMRLSERVLIEDALKHVHECRYQDRKAQVEGIAGKLSISMNRATSLVSRMTRDELLVADAEGLDLTDTGSDAAIHLIRAHRLWERYLSEETGYDEREWHERAEIMEHDLSREAIEELAVRLGNPRYDPHGDPIPATDGEGPIRSRGVPLNAVEEGRSVRVVHVEDEPATVYAQLAALEMFPGVHVRIVERSAKRIRVRAHGETHTLAPIVARNLTVVAADSDNDIEAEEDVYPLSRLSPGDVGRVVAIDRACRGAERRRLLDFGIVPGTRIFAEMRSPGGDPTAYRVRETLVALREAQARHVKVRRPQRSEMQ